MKIYISRDLFQSVGPMVCPMDSQIGNRGRRGARMDLFFFRNLSRVLWWWKSFITSLQIFIVRIGVAWEL